MKHLALYAIVNYNPARLVVGDGLDTRSWAIQPIAVDT